jgi:hypothetical protein
MPVTASGLWKKNDSNKLSMSLAKGQAAPFRSRKWRWHHEAILRSSSKLEDGRFCFPHKPKEVLD